MIGMATSRPMGILRGKIKAKWVGEVQKRGYKHNRLAWQKWQPTGPQTWLRKETTGVEAQRVAWAATSTNTLSEPMRE